MFVSPAGRSPRPDRAGGRRGVGVRAGALVAAWLAAGCAAAPTAVAPAAGPSSAGAADPAAATQAGAGAASAPDTAELRRAVVRTYADIAYAAYGDAHRTADDLATRVTAFLEAPTDDRMAAAKSAWLAARDVYGQTEVFRFYDGPIDAAGGGVEGYVNAWPLDEAYLDYVDGAPDAGIVNAVAQHPSISARLLLDLNEAGGETNIATGYHAIEFLLWGQDKSDDGPGRRPVSDYVVGRGPNAERRRAVLTLEVDLLTQHLRRVADAWDPDEMAGYRHGFVRDPDAALAKIVTGLTELSRHELSGERMAVAYETQDQEDEHSCFSDNTHNDLVAGARGIANIWRGRYGDLDGPGLEELVAAVDPAAAADVTAAVDAAQTAMAAIPPPFDQAIRGADDAPGRRAVMDAMTALEDLAAKLRVAGMSLGVMGGGGA